MGPQQNSHSFAEVTFPRAETREPGEKAVRCRYFQFKTTPPKFQKNRLCRKLGAQWWLVQTPGETSFVLGSTRSARGGRKPEAAGQRPSLAVNDFFCDLLFFGLNGGDIKSCLFLLNACSSSTHKGGGSNFSFSLSLSLSPPFYFPIPKHAFTLRVRGGN